MEIGAMSKMRTLCHKVAKEMEEGHREEMKQTRSHITYCNAFWEVFNDPKPLKNADDDREKKLENVVMFIEDWRNWSFSKFKRKEKQCKHFIS